MVAVSEVNVLPGTGKIGQFPTTLFYMCDIPSEKKF